MIDGPIYLSPPNVGDEEKAQLALAIDSGWVAPVGPWLDLFEKELGLRLADKKVLAVNSGTSALHLALNLADIGSGDDVLVGTFTFAACVNVVLYQGANPIFIDSESETWNLDPDLLIAYLSSNKKRPKAIIVTHLYGVPAKIKQIKSICEEYGLILIEDAAEALGAKYEGEPVGTFGDFGVISFNGNKLITTGGGGALISSESNYEKGLHLSTQANTDLFGYDHDQVGYNYRLSNVLASVGVAQLEKMEDFLKRKREVFNYYQSNLPSIFTFKEEPKHSFCNRWLTTPLIDDENLDPLDLIKFLGDRKIQSRPLWKPLHLNKAYTDFPFVGTGVAEGLFRRGICLPSGTALSEAGLSYIVKQINSFLS
ncbi:MAG: aminotransferase class I/II-fold pyridoxal phosphate-dependent enzyme [Cyclobacteriaceae bacterium]